MKKVLVLLMCFFTLLFVSCEQINKEMKEQEKFEKQVSKYEVVDKNITIGDHYQFFSIDKYHHTRTRAEYNVIYRNIETNKIYVAKDIKAEYYYSLEKGKIYSISNHDMIYIYKLHNFKNQTNR